MLGQIANHLPRPNPSLDCGQASTSGRCLPNVVSRTHRRRQFFCGELMGSARLDVAAAARKPGRPPSVQPDQPAAADQPPAAGKKGRKRGRKPASESIVEGPPTVLERGAPSVPLPGEFQQTLIRSFALGGIGLHTGDYAVVRVRPAFAGEGRYFVRVPEGTNKDKFKIEEAVEVDLGDAARPYERDPELEEQKVILFKQYLVAQDVEGFSGSFEQYLHYVDAKDLMERAEAGEDVQAEEYTFDEPELIQARGADEVVVPASLDSVSGSQDVTLILGEGLQKDLTVVGAEDLLAALEACGVDNARIEIEGGPEVPVLDGSALGWAMEIQFAGVRNAPQRDGSTEGVRRHALQVDQPLTVTEGDAFISFVPEQLTRLTCGVNLSDIAPVIGKQWASWSQDEDLPFRFEIAPARRYASHPEEVIQLGDAGYMRGGADGVMVIACIDKWYDATLLRFPRDEAARREMVVMVGCAALQATPGNSGLPTGHIIAYKPTLELRMKFLRALREASTAKWLPVQDIQAAQEAGEAAADAEAADEDEDEE